MMQIIEQTFDETVDMYMKCSKQELAETLAARDRHTYTDYQMSDPLDIGYTAPDVGYTSPEINCKMGHFYSYSAGI